MKNEKITMKNLQRIADAVNYFKETLEDVGIHGYFDIGFPLYPSHSDHIGGQFHICDMTLGGDVESMRALAAYRESYTDESDKYALNIDGVEFMALARKGKEK